MRGIAAAVLAVCALGCARAVPSNVISTPPPFLTDVPQPNARDGNAAFDAALASLVAHDRANDWTPSACASVAHAFDQAARLVPRARASKATYDAGLAYQRCGDTREAESRFRAALDVEPGLYFARAQVALYAFEKDRDVDAAIRAIEQAVADSKFQNAAALVDLASFQRLRGGPNGGAACVERRDGKEVALDDYDCAHLNLRRALAIDDAYMPALNQLALHHLAAAKRHAHGPHANAQELELAALVCSQAIRKNDAYAPIHNTAGLVFVELGQTNNAAREFERATVVDPRLFEAHMNLAAVNLAFRGFERAESAYRRAIELYPNDYDAHLGLALALRGPIGTGGADDNVRIARIEAELATCKRLDPRRPDALFNEGILVQYEAARTTDEKKQAEKFKAARAIFVSFIDSAKGKASYDGALQKAKDRIEDIDRTLIFMGDK
jgi:tetratricopeptide (TPR) repeat protein